jgi:hypothetical protein
MSERLLRDKVIVASMRFLVPHQQFAKAVDPAMTGFDNPSTGFIVRVLCFGLNLLPSGANMREVAPRFDLRLRGLADIARIGTQILGCLFRADNDFTSWRFAPQTTTGKWRLIPKPSSLQRGAVRGTKNA